MSELKEDVTRSRWRCPLWMRVLLVASLAGNLAVAGMVAGAALRDKPRHWAHDADGLDPRQAMLLRLVPEARQGEARDVMLRDRELVSDNRNRMQAIHGDILVALRAPEFSPDAFAAALEARSRISSEMKALIGGQMIEIISRMSPSERAEMADRMEKMARRWSERGKKH